jgi:hypothetical protein
MKIATHIADKLRTQNQWGYAEVIILAVLELNYFSEDIQQLFEQH